MNLALFSFGSMKQLLALVDGTLPAISLVELKSRLKHLTNVFEIICLGSGISDYRDENFTIGFEYNARVLSDIETNVKSWSDLNPCIDPTCWPMCEEMHIVE